MAGIEFSSKKVYKDFERTTTLQELNNYIGETITPYIELKEGRGGVIEDNTVYIVYKTLNEMRKYTLKATQLADLFAGVDTSNEVITNIVIKGSKVTFYSRAVYENSESSGSGTSGGGGNLGGDDGGNSVPL
jgi:hypothetical protein